ncbi:MAG: hypothetical protein ABGX87_12435 [Alcanivorax sp.]
MAMDQRKDRKDQGDHRPESHRIYLDDLERQEPLSIRQGWQAPFRDKLMRQLGETDLLFLMGNMHRHRHQWLIVSLIYPPKEPQQTLF